MSRGPYVGRGTLGIVTTIVLGVLLAESGATRDSATGEDAAWLDSAAIMGSVTHRNLSGAFRGGEAAAVMGRLEVDLRDATMAREEIVIEVDVLMGRIELLVPEEWRVVSEVDAALGRAEISTSHRDTEAGAPRLVVRGGVLMGRLYVGIEVHPILASGQRQALYLASWALIGLLLAVAWSAASPRVALPT